MHIILDYQWIDGPLHGIIQFLKKISLLGEQETTTCNLKIEHETSFRVMVQETYKLLWIKITLEALKITLKEFIKIFYDNKFAFNIVQNLIQHNHTKYIEVNRNFIKEKLKRRLICISYMPIENQFFDIFIKEFYNPIFM